MHAAFALLPVSSSAVAGSDGSGFWREAAPFSANGTFPEG
jgi:hypothetical protein